MRLSSRLKLTKYWLKSHLLALSPATYWNTRRALRGVWEREITMLPALCRKDALALDIGGHFGMYTHELLKCAARVEAFEPIPVLAEVLRKGYQGDSRVTVHAVALSGESGEVALRVPRAGWGRSTIETSNPLAGRRDPTAPIDTVTVAMRTLDSFALANVAFIKMDVEGHEVTVLRGALATLAREHPALLIEIEERHRSCEGGSVADLLAPLGYSAYQCDGNGLTRARVADSNNYLFLTAAHLTDLARRGVHVHA